MSDELKAAAERLRRYAAGESWTNIWGNDDPGTDRTEDRRLIVAAYLREHPADDREGSKQSLLQSVLVVCAHRGWSLHWTHRSAYLHLEAAELAEAVRGKRGDKLQESADVLITLLALSQCELPDIVGAAEAKLASLMTKPIYAGEETSRRTT